MFRLLRPGHLATDESVSQGRRLRLQTVYSLAQESVLCPHSLHEEVGFRVQKITTLTETFSLSFKEWSVNNNKCAIRCKDTASLSQKYIIKNLNTHISYKCEHPTLFYKAVVFFLALSAPGGRGQEKMTCVWTTSSRTDGLVGRQSSIYLEFHQLLLFFGFHSSVLLLQLLHLLRVVA